MRPRIGELANGELKSAERCQTLKTLSFLAFSGVDGRIGHPLASARYRFVTPWMGGVGITPYAAGQFTTFDLPAYAE
jgi:hypothetical protein